MQAHAAPLPIVFLRSARIVQSLRIFSPSTTVSIPHPSPRVGVSVVTPEHHSALLSNERLGIIGDRQVLPDEKTQHEINVISCCA
jgi:hypothetical protein